MKKYFLIPVIVILLAGCKTKNTVGAKGVAYKTALEYNEYIIHLQMDMKKDITEYTDAANVSIDEADKSLDKIINDASIKLKEIEGMPAFNGDTAFRNAAIALFSFYKTSFSNDFKEMHQLQRKVAAGTATDDVQEKLDKFEDVVSEKEAPLDAKFQETQAKFAKENNLTLIASDSK